MKKCIIVLCSFVIIFSTDVWSQSECNAYLKVVEAGKSEQLRKFWQGLEITVRTKDKVAMANYFHFPFTSAPFIEGDSASKVITKYDFLSKYYKILLLKGFIKTLSSKKISEVLFSSPNDSNKCELHITVPLVNASKKNGEGVQAFMTIKEFATGFKIVSIWTVP